jgi:phage shock protein PspC (stress-responsive transcriptional regulator)
MWIDLGVPKCKIILWVRYGLDDKCIQNLAGKYEGMTSFWDLDVNLIMILKIQTVVNETISLPFQVMIYSGLLCVTGLYH